MSGRCTAACSTLGALAEVVVVEGVGGLLVPLGENFDAADLAVALALPVILVVGMRLGCINHALLTDQAIAARGLKLVGWVANRIDPAMSALRKIWRRCRPRSRRRCSGCSARCRVEAVRQRLAAAARPGRTGDRFPRPDLPDIKQLAR